MELWEMEFDETKIQPTMRKVCRWLRSNGYVTTDSGDGVINVLAGMEGALDRPHVFMQVGSPYDGVRSAQGLLKLCQEKGLAEGYRIEYLYSPIDGVGVLALYGVSDAQMPE